MKKNKLIFTFAIFLGIFGLLVSCSKNKETTASPVPETIEPLNAADAAAVSGMATETVSLREATTQLASAITPEQRHHWDSTFHHHDSLYWVHHNHYNDSNHHAHNDHHHEWVPYDPAIDHTHHHHHVYPNHHDSLVVVSNGHHPDHNTHHPNIHSLHDHHVIDSLDQVHHIHHP